MNDVPVSIKPFLLNVFISMLLANNLLIGIIHLFLSISE